MQSSNTGNQFVVCINNQDHQASLEVRKIYQIIPNANAAKHQMIRVIDESESDYLHPSSYFVPIKLPKAAESAFSMAI